MVIKPTNSYSKEFNGKHGTYCYNIHDEIGKGSFGHVYKGINKQTKEVVAIKLINLKFAIKEHTKLILKYIG